MLLEPVDNLYFCIFLHDCCFHSPDFLCKANRRWPAKRHFSQVTYPTSHLKWSKLNLWTQSMDDCGYLQLVLLTRQLYNNVIFKLCNIQS